ncbi:YbdD/YjiX family protein [Skermanella rosea]|uniref:YbdD/YjiX family protein n=1 Tax=Skermanella rosea TaxID=1817965 RepID=UPI001932FFA0|nr:CstA-like transporter-associated (seleno)protein [Skermanella rosea]UEM03481.1 YbdD/YjiX family protein [Skermanella rosea]
MHELRSFLGRLRETGRLMVGIPCYDTYVAHRLANHPDEPVMTYEEFFRDRQDTRYGAKGGGMNRCC